MGMAVKSNIQTSHSATISYGRTEESTGQSVGNINKNDGGRCHCDQYPNHTFVQTQNNYHFYKAMYEESVGTYGQSSSNHQNVSGSNLHFSPNWSSARNEEDGPSLRCDICLKRLANCHTLKQHMLVHADTRDFECDTCAKRFKRNGDLAKHKKICPPDARNFECDVCAKRFKRSCDLTKHRNSAHPFLLQFTCHVCAMRFRNLQSLTYHSTIRHDDRQFACYMCPKSFKTKYCLKKHKKLHLHKDHPFSCGVCLRSFYRQNDLSNHKKSHTCDRLFPCNLCVMCFQKHSCLVRHLKTHHDDMPSPFDLRTQRSPQKGIPSIDQIFSSTAVCDTRT